jgi:hypothetical protein
VTDPETITQDELAEALRRRSYLPDPDRYAREILADVVAHREPGYEPGRFYLDDIGQVFYRCLGNGNGWSLMPNGSPYPHDYPVRPLRKLVPGPVRPAHAAVLAEIVAWDGGRYGDLADRICKLLEASDGH